MLKSLFSKVLVKAWWCATLSRKKTLVQVFSCKSSEIFKKTYFAGHARMDAWVKWTKKIVITKFIYRKTPVMASFFVQLQTYRLTVSPKGTLSQMLFYENWSFTKHHFYKTMLCDCLCLWFSIHHLLYQW